MTPTSEPESSAAAAGSVAVRGPGIRPRIATVAARHPELVDDRFVAEHRDDWLR